MSPNIAAEWHFTFSECKGLSSKSILKAFHKMDQKAFQKCSKSIPTSSVHGLPERFFMSGISVIFCYQTESTQLSRNHRTTAHTMQHGQRMLTARAFMAHISRIKTTEGSRQDGTAGQSLFWTPSARSHKTRRLSPEKRAVLRQSSWPVTKCHSKDFHAISEKLSWASPCRVEWKKNKLSMLSYQGGGNATWPKNEKCLMNKMT